MSEKILIETSARHIHVTQEALEALFGKGAVLTKKKIFLSRGSLPVKSG